MTDDPQFEVIASDQPGVAVLAARGEIDVASAPEFQTSLSDLIDEGPNILVVDTSDVSFIDSTGLGVLIGAEKQMRGDGRRLRLVVTQPQITRLLALTGLDEVFTVMSTTNDAVSRVTSPLSTPDIVDTGHGHRVELSLAADAQMLFLARMTGAAVASRADFEYEQVEDLRLAIDELCVRLIGAAIGGGRLALLFQWDDEGTLDVTGTMIPDNAPLINGRRPRAEVSSASHELSERILDALVDDHGGDTIGDVHRAWLRMRRQDRTG